MGDTKSSLCVLSDSASVLYGGFVDCLRNPSKYRVGEKHLRCCPINLNDAYLLLYLDRAFCQQTVAAGKVLATVAPRFVECNLQQQRSLK